MRSALALLPGILLGGAIAAAAFLLRHIPGMATLSPMILAIVIGMAFHNTVGTPSFAKVGIAFSLRRLLRFAIVLLGYQLTLTEIAGVGVRGLLIIAITVVATFTFTVWVGRALGVDPKLSQLIAAGTSICGPRRSSQPTRLPKHTTRMLPTRLQALRYLAQSPCLPILYCKVSCASILRHMGCGAALRSMRSRK
jgi:hypothetical protein